MPIPFHDADDIEELGAAAFLRVLQPPSAPTRTGAPASEWLGALFFINARGEPLEFAHNRIELVGSALWRPADREQAAARRLAMTLFQAATLTPSFLLCRAGEVGPHLFGPAGQLAVQIPVGRVATPHEAVGYTGAEQQETLATTDGAGEACEAHLFWTPAPPTGAGAALLARLVERGLLLEPFERLEKGLHEVYGERPAEGA